MDREKLIIDLLSHENYIPMKKKEIAVLLGLSKKEKLELDDVLNSLICKNKIIITKRGKVMIKDDDTSLIGEFRANDRGFGFVTVDGFKEDFYIPSNVIMGAIDGDIVKIKTSATSDGKSTEASIVEIVKRVKIEFVGTFEHCGDFGFVVPDSLKMKKHIFVKKGNFGGAKDGNKVLVKINDYGNRDKKPEGEIIEILGMADDPTIDSLSVLKELAIPIEFPSKVIREVEAMSEQIDLSNRKDFTNLKTVTIDGADAKDLDDAVSIQKTDFGYRLYVHIADVSNYVTPNSELNKEAFKRGTSVYLADRVVPMLPKKISNNLCSLNKGEPKLTLSVIMDIDEKGKVKDYEIEESVVSIDERMTYDDVYSILCGDEQLKSKYAHLLEEFNHMEQLAKILRKNRKNRGSIDFNLNETKVEVDEKGKVTNIGFYKTTFANKIIEEFMLITNEVIAEHFYWQEIPFVYRNHEEPTQEKVARLATFIRGFGYVLKGSDELHPKSIQKLLIDAEGSDEEALITRVALRSMKQAKYESDSKGHFGLATKFYCHFTSPIRRYPDLIIHRIIKDSINGRLNSKKINYYKGILGDIAAKCSKLERRAIMAEREVVKIKMAQYMADKIGETYSGIIQSVTKWGMYVELKNSVEGLVRVEDLKDDIYYFDENYSLVGVNNGKYYTIGDKVDIQVKDVDLVNNRIDFEVI